VAVLLLMIAYVTRERRRRHVFHDHLAKPKSDPAVQPPTRPSRTGIPSLFSHKSLQKSFPQPSSPEISTLGSLLSKADIAMWERRRFTSSINSKVSTVRTHGRVCSTIGWSPVDNTPINFLDIEGILNSATTHEGDSPKSDTSSFASLKPLGLFPRVPSPVLPLSMPPRRQPIRKHWRNHRRDPSDVPVDPSAMDVSGTGMLASLQSGTVSLPRGTSSLAALGSERLSYFFGRVSDVLPMSPGRRSFVSTSGTSVSHLRAKNQSLVSMPSVVMEGYLSKE
jgi:hypothetical protein